MNNKLHNILSLCIGLLFLLILQKLSISRPVFRILVPVFGLFVLLVSAYNRWYLQQLQKYNFWIVLRHALLLLAGLGLFLILPNSGLRGAFLVTSVLLIAFFEYFLGSFSENILMLEILVIAFGLFMALAAGAQDYPGYGSWFVILAFAASLLLSRCFYEFIPQPSRTKLVVSLTLGLLMAQLFWAFSFLPFHFSALAVMLFNLYYFCLALNYYYFFETLNLKKMQFHLGLVVAASAAVILATPWKIIT